MPRLMIDDPSRTNPLALLTTAKLAAITDAVTPNQTFIKAIGDATLRIDENCVFALGEQNPMSIFITAEATIGAANLDSGEFVMGRDYYVYICDNGSNAEVFSISLNSTFPAGFNAANSRKIGGFHYGKCRRVDSLLRPINPENVAYGAGWGNNVYDGIVPRSVWTIRHRPKCTPEGMVYLGSNTWVDIYLSSSDGAGGMQSVLGALPLTGTEGHNWYSFNDRSLMNGKRLLNYAEFCRMAYGSPQGNNDNNIHAWTATTNTARNPTGGVANAVSSIGTRDAVGNVWEWLDEFITNASGRVLSGTTSPTPYTYAATDGGRGGKVNVVGTYHGVRTRADHEDFFTAGGYGWDYDSPLGDTTGGNIGSGNIHEYYDQSLIALRSGGNWKDGVHAGARAVNLSGSPWSVGASSGVRCACESL